MNTEDLKKILLEKEQFTIPDIQHEYGLKYAEVHKCVLQLINEDRLILSDGLTYFVQDSDPPVAKTKGEDTLQKEDYDEFILRRRRELMERFTRLYEEKKHKLDEEDDELDDSDEYDDEEDDAAEDADRDEKNKMPPQFGTNTLIHEIESCRMVRSVNYDELAKSAQKIIETMALFDCDLTTRAIQLGPDTTRFVFGCVTSRDITTLSAYESDIRASISADSIEVIAPFGPNQIAVVAYHDGIWDPLCKKALCFWLERNGGKASIASLQRNLGIGFNHSGRIKDQLQQLGCVDTIDPSESASKTLHVTVTKEDVEVLFPQTLGWEI